MLLSLKAKLINFIKVSYMIREFLLNYVIKYLTLEPETVSDKEMVQSVNHLESYDDH